MKRKFKIFLTLAVILLLAAFFRLYQLGKVPPSPSLDEVSIGWNAYSILKTGRDEYGTKLPILLRAYDDWRPAGYVYLVIPFVKLLGLSPVAVRLPSVLLSLATVIATYFLVKELFPQKRLASCLSLVASFLLAISPWHIYMSRLGHEVNAGLAFSVLAVFFFLKAVNQKKSFLFFVAAIFFSLSLYTYQSQKIFVPALIIALAFIYRQKLFQRKKEVVIAGLVGLVLFVPILFVSLSPGGLIRFQATSIFNQQNELKELAFSRMTRNYRDGSLLGLIFDNQKVAAGITFLSNYFSHFDPRWLFFNQGRESHKVPGLGVLYFWELPLLLIGAYQLVKSKFPRKSKWLLFSWLLLAPLPASLTTQAPHAMRAFNLLPMPQILTAMGLTLIIFKLKSNPKQVLFWCGGTVILLFSLAYFAHNYFVNFPIEQSDSFQYPLAQSIRYVAEVEKDYDKVIFSNQDHGYQSYMFFLFFNQYSPVDYLGQGGTVSGGFAETHAFDKYEFRPINWGEEEKRPGVLYVGNVTDFPQGVQTQEVLPLLNGQEALKAVAP